MIGQRILKALRTHPEGLTQQQLFDRIWPGHAPRSACQNFHGALDRLAAHVTISRPDRTLGNAARRAWPYRLISETPAEPRLIYRREYRPVHTSTVYQKPPELTPYESLTAAICGDPRPGRSALDKILAGKTLVSAQRNGLPVPAAGGRV